MKHLLSLFVDRFPGRASTCMGTERNGKETHPRERQHNRRPSGGVCKSGTAAGEGVGRQIAVRHSER